jgi:hypothetical protein
MQQLRVSSSSHPAVAEEEEAAAKNEKCKKRCRKKEIATYSNEMETAKIA